MIEDDLEYIMWTLLYAVTYNGVRIINTTKACVE